MAKAERGHGTRRAYAGGGGRNEVAVQWKGYRLGLGLLIHLLSGLDVCLAVFRQHLVPELGLVLVVVRVRDVEKTVA